MAGLPQVSVHVPTGRHGLPADVVATHQRQRLIAATIDLVAKRGYQGTSIDHIVKGARVGYVAFYDLFEGKEACFIAAFDRIVEDAHRATSAAVDPQAPWAEQVRAVLAALVAEIAADPARARVGLVEAQAAGPLAFQRYEAAIDGAIPLLRRGRELTGAAAALSDSLEEAVVGGIAWVLHQRLVTTRGEEVEGLLVDITEIALAPYLGEAEARRLATIPLKRQPESD
jgi:AcrR family transcriptional regulator